MPKTKQQKQEIINTLAEKFSRMKSAVFTSVSGYTMDDANTLRAKGRDEGVDFLIAKKTLLVRALEKSGITLSKDTVGGSILTAIGYNNEIAPAKLIHAFSKDREGVKIVGGILEGNVVDGASVKQLAGLPSKQELFAQLVGSFNAPVSGFVNVLAGNLRGFVCVLNAIQETKV